MENLLKPQKVAEILSVKITTIYSWAKSGKIPSVKLNGAVRFDSREVEEWVRSNKIKPMETDKKVRRILNSARGLDIDSIVRKSIDSVKGSGYNPPQGKPDLNQAQKKGGRCGAL